MTLVRAFFLLWCALLLGVVLFLIWGALELSRAMALGLTGVALVFFGMAAVLMWRATDS